MTVRYDPPFDRVHVPAPFAGHLDASGNQVPYGRSWDEMAKAYLEKHPYCERCLKDGKHVKAALVHHKEYVANGGEDKASNMEALCHRCHELEHKRHHKDMRFDRQEEEDMDEVQESLERLKRYEANLYRGEKAAREAMDEQEPETVEEALERLKDIEANNWQKEV